MGFKVQVFEYTKKPLEKMQICENGDGIRMGIQSKKWCGYFFFLLIYELNKTCGKHNIL